MTSAPPTPLRAVPPTGPKGRSNEDGDATDELVAKARAGDPRAWATLYEASFPDLMRHVAYMVFDVNAAEDIVQEAFVIAFGNIERYQPTGSFVGWVRGIAQNLVRGHWRKRGRRQRAHARLQVVRDVQDGPPGPEQQLGRERQADALAVAVEALPEKLREAFVLADLRELSAAEGADALGITPQNFRVRVFRARERLREALGGDDD